jgi:hypothetical protein
MRTYLVEVGIAHLEICFDCCLEAYRFSFASVEENLFDLRLLLLRVVINVPWSVEYHRDDSVENRAWLQHLAPSCINFVDFLTFHCAATLVGWLRR